jgi:hypothetical protein
MTAEVAIAISFLSLVAQFVNAWLNQRMRTELAELQLKIDAKMARDYIPRGEFEREVHRIDQGCTLRHPA